MILLTAANLTKIYGEKQIFKDISLSIHTQEKIGLIGINGTGKSSLLKILAGKETADQGEITTSNELVLEYLPQNPIFEEDATVLEQVFKGESPLLKLLTEYEKAVTAVENDPQNSKYLNELMALSEQMDQQDAWQLESEAKMILNQLGIQDFHAKVATLSGGQKKRIALAGVLIRPCNLLILDEPTNHLDNETIDYLEEMLKNKKTAVLMVTHDRYFLDRVANKMLELEAGRLHTYEGNYEKYLELKEGRQSRELRMEEKEKTLYKKELEWMRKGVEARRTKQKARQERFFELEGRLMHKQDEKMEMNLSTSRLGKKIIEAKSLAKSFDEFVCFKAFTHTFTKSDRIGIIGKNGTGKSTLLNILSGNLLYDEGTLEIGDTAKIGYYTQESSQLEDKMRVIDYIKDKKEYLKMQDGSLISASKMLEKFLFPAHMQYSPIGKLSGGEKRRLYLLGILMNDINILLLDEPTNDLDIETLQILEDYMDGFVGPIVVVSHDRYFLDKTVDTIFELKNQAFINYPGNYSDYLARKKEEKEEGVENKKDKKNPVKIKPTNELRFSYQEKREYESIENDIAQLEEKIEIIEQEMQKNASNYGKLNELVKQKEEVEEELIGKMERWEYLSTLEEKIKQASK